MLVHLEQGDSLFFEGLWREWQTIERQVDRLGFGDKYIVTQRKSKRSGTRVNPVSPSD
jgi:hypothetical protein